LSEAVRLGRPLALPALALTLAWFVRGLCQGAACHYVQEVLLGTKGEPSAWAAMKAALGRAPALFITVAYLFTFNTLTLVQTLGIGFFVLAAQGVGYAAVMQGRGSPLRLYGLCSRLLGPARGTAMVVRILMGVQLLAFFNLHIAANFALILGRKLAGIDLTFAERFASLDTPSWLLFLAAMTFALFEPVRAAAATLLLVDGRVRQEGLDLLAAVQQLPARNAGRPLGSKSAAVLALVSGVLTWSGFEALREPASLSSDVTAVAAVDAAGAHTPVTLTVRSFPEGAQVLRADTGEVLGVTPLIRQLPADKASIGLRVELAGYVPSERVVRLDTHAVLEFPLAKAQTSPRQTPGSSRPAARKGGVRDAVIDPFAAP
ncbi:hypothetical protein ACLESD_51315, partial [Pyxidicoccus sp. 3LFB2]